VNGAFKGVNPSLRRTPLCPKWQSLVRGEMSAEKEYLKSHWVLQLESFVACMVNEDETIQSSQHF